MYNQLMPEDVLTGEVTSWCGTKIIIEVRRDKNGKMYFQKLDTELPSKKVHLLRVRDACNVMLRELE